MSKKFLTPVETHSLGRVSPMSAEQDRSGLGKYARYSENSIYYYNSLQFCGSGLYRAALGYEIIWDKKAEANLMLCLDYLLTDYRDKQQYYFEELSSKQHQKLWGIKWHRGIMPKSFNFDLQWPFEIKKGERITARINLLDKPNHVDLELPNGEVFTLQYIRYQRIRHQFKVKEEVNVSKYSSSTKSPESSKGKSLSLAPRIRQSFPFKKIPFKLSSMR